MKITAIILLSACLTAAATGHGQQITLTQKDATLEQVFSEIKKQSGYTFFYADNLLHKAKKVTISTRDASIEEVLDIVFRDQPLTYSIIDKADKFVVIKLKEPKSSVTLSEVEGPVTLSAVEVDIKGRITNEDGEPVAASIIVKGTQQGTTSNAEGYFELKGVDENSILVISGISIETREIKVGGKTDLAIVAKTKVTSLNEVIINKGYYTEKQKFSIANVGKVTARDIEKQPVSNPLLALQGRVPGLQITQTSGLSGAGVVVRIQGQNSLLNGNGPLYVVDGVPIETEIPAPIGYGPLPNSGVSYIGQGLNGRGNTLNYANPSDIESIEILKDADATAIYGSRAANGAILITTKKGKAGKTVFNADIQQGWGQVGHFMDLLNTNQYLEMRNEALKNDNLIPSSDPFASSPSFYAPDLTLCDTTRFTDWQKELIGKSAQYTNATASISGGSSSIQYLASATYHRETTVFPVDFSNRRGSMHLNLNNSNDLKQKFHFQISTNYSVDKNELPQTDLTELALTLIPNAPALYNNDGSLNWQPDANGISTFTNPLAPLFYQTYSTKTNNLIANANLNYDILPALKIGSSFGYTNLQSTDIVLNSLSALKPEDRPFSQRIAVYGNSEFSSWIIEPQASYRKTFGKHNFDALIGSTFQRTYKEAGYTAAGGFNDDQVMTIPTAASIVRPVGHLRNIYKYSALYSRLNYRLLDKYILNLTGRRDGSSRFGEKSRFHNFWSIGAGWIFSEETFFQKHLPFFSFGKLKGNYGAIGSDQIGDYRFITLYNIVRPDITYQGTTGLEPADLPNPHLQWEETKKLSLGIDIGLFNNRILLGANYARNRSSNQLLAYNLPRMTGRSSVLTNFPATLQNTSWEFSLNTENIKGKTFNWTTSINLTIPRNKLVAFPDLENSTYKNNFIVGQPVDVQKLYRYAGVDPATGGYTFFDSTGKVTNSPNRETDRTLLISRFSNFYGGIQNSVTYKGFELSFLVQFVKQKAPSPAFGYKYYPGRFYDYSGQGNQPALIMSRWQKPGDSRNVQMFAADNSNIDDYFSILSNSDAVYEDASYARLKNLSLSWELPSSWKQKAYLQTCRIYVQGQNLFTVTNFKGLDPETTSYTTLPPLRVVTLGLQVRL